MAGETENRISIHLNVISFKFRCITLNLNMMQNDTITIQEQRLICLLVSLIYKVAFPLKCTESYYKTF